MWIPADTMAMTVKTAVSTGWLCHSVGRNAPVMTYSVANPGTKAWTVSKTKPSSLVRRL
jgi:hypothetical protein